MLFDDKEISWRRLSTGKRNLRRKPILKVNTRLETQTRTRMSRVAAFVLIPVVIIIAGFFMWKCCRLAGELLFLKNDRFTIRNLEIKIDLVVPRDFIRGKKKIREGMNLFGFNIRKVRDEFLRGAPNFKSMEISRHLPDTLKIEVIERTPLARIGRSGYLVVDNDGSVFGLRLGKRNLTIIMGYKGPRLKPGDKIRGPARDAMDVLDICEKTALGREVVITGIDVRGGFEGRDDALRLYLAGKTRVDLWWHRREHKNISPYEDLHRRLLCLRDVVRDARRKKKPLKTVNLTLDSYMVNCPITPRWR